MCVVHVPVSIAVRKYFLKEFNNQLINHNQVDALKLTRNDFLGNFVACLMTDDLSEWKLTRPEPDSLVLVLSRRFETCYVTEKLKRKLAFHLEQWFKREFILYIDMCVNFGESALSAVDKFCRFYEIEEDEAGQDSLYRYYTRFGKTHIDHSRPTKAVA